MILRTYWYGFLTDIFRFRSWFRFWWRWRRWSRRFRFWLFVLFLLPVVFFRLDWLNFRFDNLNDSSFFPRFWWFRVWFRLYFSVSSNNFNFGFRIFLFSFAIWSPIWIFSSPWRFILFGWTVYSRVWSVLFRGSMHYSYDHSKWMVWLKDPGPVSADQRPEEIISWCSISSLFQSQFHVASKWSASYPDRYRSLFEVWNWSLLRHQAHLQVFVATTFLQIIVRPASCQFSLQWGFSLQ